MADIKNVNRAGGNEIAGLTGNQIPERDAPRVGESSVRTNNTKLPVGKSPDARPGELGRQPETTGVGQSAESIQTEIGRQLSALGGVSATDKLLGLDLRPTMTGLLAPPPGNVEFLRHLSPQARRTIMRKMLARQRDRMRRLARYLRDRRDDHEEAADEESFLEVISEPVSGDRQQVARATTELEKAARMLNILDEMLAMQDYTISQMGTFTQG